MNKIPFARKNLYESGFDNYDPLQKSEQFWDALQKNSIGRVCRDTWIRNFLTVPV